MKKYIEKIIKDYEVGARDILTKLQAWETNEAEAKKQERNAREMFLNEICEEYSLATPDGEEEGKIISQARELWQERIIDNILSQDPAFME